jgi:ketosteroid isomerase-like protein
MESAGAIATLDEFVRRINTHDPKAIVSLCTADHIFIDSLGSQVSGRERLEQAWAGYFSLFPDYRIEVEAAASQNTVVLACGFASATHAASKKSWADSSCMARYPEERTDCRVAGLCR